MMLAKDPKRMLDYIRAYVNISPYHKKEDEFLGHYFIVIIIYGTTSPLYRLPNITTLRMFVLEYIKQLVDIDKIHFLISKKKRRRTFSIMMGRYDVNIKNSTKEAIKVLEKFIFPQDHPWKYDPYFIIGVEKGRKKPNPQDHEFMTLD